jgi:hypothetical protein
MPRVIVTIDQDKQQAASAPVLLNEYVDSLHLDDSHSAAQFVERLGWAISDAENLERGGRDAWSS